MRETISVVSVGRRLGVPRTYCIRFEDSSGGLESVHVHTPYRIQQIIAELRSNGYRVLDRESGTELDRQPRP
jgi:hypothetical protein